MMGSLASCFLVVIILNHEVVNCSSIYGNAFEFLTSDHQTQHSTNREIGTTEHTDLTSPVVEIERNGPSSAKEEVTLTEFDETGEWAKEVVPEILKNLPVDPLTEKTDDVHGNGNVSLLDDVVAGKMDEFHEKEKVNQEQTEVQGTVQDEANDGFGPFSNEMKSSPEEDHEYEWLEEPVQESVRPVEESVVPGISQSEKPSKDQVLSQVETGLVYLMKTAHNSGLTVEDIMDHLRNRLQSAVDKEEHKQSEGLLGEMRHLRNRLQSAVDKQEHRQSEGLLVRGAM